MLQETEKMKSTYIYFFFAANLYKLLTRRAVSTNLLQISSTPIGDVIVAVHVSVALEMLMAIPNSSTFPYVSHLDPHFVLSVPQPGLPWGSNS